VDLVLALLGALVAGPGLAFLMLSLTWLLGWMPNERSIVRISHAGLLVSAVALAGLLFLLQGSASGSVAIALGDWFRVHEYHFPLVLLVDALSLPLVGLTILLTAVISAFSRTYMHREPGFLRFYLQLNLFAFGALIVLTAGSFDLMIGGWELVGLSSVLLIAFFEERTGPVRNAIRVFAVYRATDVGLLVGVFLMHHWAESATYADLFAGDSLTGGHAMIVGLLLLFAASGKSAQIPFSGWLPRAMEGPTPSSAIFYGAISVHLGAYLLLRAQPILQASPWAAAATVVVGAATAAYGTLVGRACSDAKTGLSFAALSQLGLIFVEIGLGWTTLALFHILGHAAVRTLQFLRAPSTLHDFHQVHAAAGGQVHQAGEFYEAWLPVGLRLWLYRFAMDRGHLDTFLDRGFGQALHALAGWLNAPALRSEKPAGRPAPVVSTKTAGGLE